MRKACAAVPIIWLMGGLPATSQVRIQMPPTEAQIDQIIARLRPMVPRQGANTEALGAWETAAAEALRPYSLRGASLVQLRKLALAGILYDSQVFRIAAAPRLAELAEGKSAEAAEAAALRAFCYPGVGDPEAMWKGLTQAHKALLAHPALAEFLRQPTPESGLAFAHIANFPPDRIREADLLQVCLPGLGMKMSPLAAEGAMKVFDAASDPGSGCPAALRERIRRLVLDRTKDGIQFLKVRMMGGNAGPEAYQILESLGKHRLLLEGALAKGQLIGSPAPSMSFKWSSAAGLKRLSDLKGKVVLADFWATWCGPCLRGFPNLARLQERYKGYPVVILGITSLQGFHRDPATGARISTYLEAGKEYDLMSKLMKDKGVTWSVAFSRDEVFNPDYGIKAVPHAAILDAGGKVRFNGLRAYDSPKGMADKIDALLREAGLPCPAAPMEDGNFAEPGDRAQGPEKMGGRPQGEFRPGGPDHGDGGPGGMNGGPR